MIHSNLFKALADETRLRCLVLLSTEDNLCVCELCHATTLSQPKISRHLALLRKQGLVTDRRQGQWIFYELNANLPQWAKDILDIAAQGLHQQDPFKADEKRLQAMDARPQRSFAA